MQYHLLQKKLMKDADQTSQAYQKTTNLPVLRGSKKTSFDFELSEEFRTAWTLSVLTAVFRCSHMGELWPRMGFLPLHVSERQEKEEEEETAWVHIENSWHALLNLCMIHSQYNELKSENFPTFFFNSLYFSGALCLCVKLQVPVSSFKQKLQLWLWQHCRRH